MSSEEEEVALPSTECVNSWRNSVEECEDGDAIYPLPDGVRFEEGLNKRKQ